MNTNVSVLPSEVAALVHHVELNRAGWWDKAVQRLVLAAVWLSQDSLNKDGIQKILKDVFKLSLTTEKLTLALSVLETEDLLIVLRDGSYRIPDKQRKVFEQDIAAAEKIEMKARGFFFGLVTGLNLGLNEKTAWSVFESNFLIPLIQEVGANAYRLISGDEIIVDKNLVTRFLGCFKAEVHSKLKTLIARFLDPKRDEARVYISRMLHARFCVEASGLSAEVIERLNSTITKQIKFCIFVDTNFLFSLLELHENPSNAVASELQVLISQLKSNPRVELFIIPRTIEEVKTSITAAKYQLSGIPAGNNITSCALQIGLSGMAEKFLVERLRRSGNLTVEDWFDPYLKDFVPIARGKGIELFNEKTDTYSMRQDVIDDIMSVMKYEENLSEGRRKSYEKVTHDMVLWHFVNDKRPAYVESPLDAQHWILTVDYRLIGFDEYKQKGGAKVPLCLHPTSLIQLLQFWVPRSKEFEEAILGSLRLPFLFQEFDVEAERISLKILKGLGRFDGCNDIPGEVITRVILNEGLRSRLKFEESQEKEVALIRDVLLEQMKLRVDEVKQAKDSEIAKLKIKVTEGESRSRELNAKLMAQRKEIAKLSTKQLLREEAKKQRHAVLSYFGQLVIVVLVAGIVVSQIERILPEWCRIVGLMFARVLVGIFMFVVGHLCLEWRVRGNPRMAQLWPYKQVKRFRKSLLFFVGVSFLTGVLANLFANRIQENLDQNQSSISLPPAISLPDKHRDSKK
ncbi:MAG: hypothetical protein MJA29_08680 [Candidatus Omnitrophica bacterium]|nr:hypothetical protein [Candidatus Omnitrophota bacterium]